jgi:hypothetical protein
VKGQIANKILDIDGNLCYNILELARFFLRAALSEYNQFAEYIVHHENYCLSYAKENQCVHHLRFAFVRGFH